MKTKKCSKCKKLKPLSEFHKDSGQKSGLRPFCKICVHKYYEYNKLRLIKKQKEYYKENKEEISKKTKDYYQRTKDKKYEYYLKNKDKKRKYNKFYNKTHRQLINNQKKSRYQTEIIFKINSNLHNRIRDALKKNIKSTNTMFLIGCEIDYLMYHIQEKFTKGMTWDNHGDWHIDHIKPCAKFDLSKESEQLKCFNYTNLQPLWAIDNLRKGNKYEKFQTHVGSKSES